MEQTTSKFIECAYCEKLYEACKFRQNKDERCLYYEPIVQKRTKSNEN